MKSDEITEGQWFKFEPEPCDVGLNGVQAYHGNLVQVTRIVPTPSDAGACPRYMIRVALGCEIEAYADELAPLNWREKLVIARITTADRSASCPWCWLAIGTAVAVVGYLILFSPHIAFKG